MSRLNKNVLKTLRSVMAQKKIDIYVLPRTDEHQSEYLTPSSERVAFLSNFTGSNALALISQRQACLWTDGRYYLQAAKQLSQQWEMKKMIEGQQKWYEHITTKYQPNNSSIEIDARLITAKATEERKKYFEEKKYPVSFADRNLVDQLWTNRPKEQRVPIFSHEEHAGKTITEKISWIRNRIREKKGQGAIFTDLGQIAWILNLRSGEIPFNPFFKAILIIGLEDGTLYLPNEQPSVKDQKIIGHLKTQNIIISTQTPTYGPKLLCQTNQINYSIYRQIKQPIQWDGIGLYRAIRTQKQIQGFKRAHLVDGIAMARFWAWRSTLPEVNQHEAALYMDKMRKQQPGNMGLSFHTISGGGANGAIIHYHTSQHNSSMVTQDMIHLVDSGGQYIDGTTDVTRAFHFGQPTPQEKDAYTRVLLGNLDIERLRWPKSVKLTGIEVDILARRHLWKKGLEYGHGTGHGVGFFGSVHEGPVGISRLNKTVFQPNMIVTNEPGFYEPGKFGIRIENMLYVKQMENNMLGFHNLTLCPYDKNLLDFGLLNKEDVHYINDYHARVWQELSPHLREQTQVLAWLKNVTSPITITP